LNNNSHPIMTNLFYIQCATFLFLNVLIGIFSVTVFILGFTYIFHFMGPSPTELEWSLCLLIWSGYIIFCLCLNIFIFRGMSTGFRWGMFILGICIITISGILFGGTVAEQFSF
jgi:hypothetical protein